jgi:hypothetical protein
MEPGGTTVSSPIPSTTPTDPTGLDYHEAFKAMYPGMAGTTVRVHELNDAALRMVKRAAQLRRAERERVKAEFLAALAGLDNVEIALSGLDYVRAEMMKKAEEIR